MILMPKRWYDCCKSSCMVDASRLPDTTFYNNTYSTQSYSYKLESVFSKSHYFRDVFYSHQISSLKEERLRCQ